jgi:iron complex transport system substrate-binding protein
MTLFNLFLLSLFMVSQVGGAPLEVKDDTGLSVILTKPAMRIVSLSPHATELLFALGGGSQVVAVDQASNYPRATQSIKKIADFQSVQLDTLLLLKPDLVVIWQNQALEKHLALLRQHHIPVFVSRPRSFTEIATNFERLGILLGKANKGKAYARALLTEVAQVQKKYQAKPKVTVYLQLSDQPMLSVSNRLFIGEMLNYCGGKNPFAHSALPTPVVNIEAVLIANPEVMLYVNKPASFWHHFSHLKAIKNKAVFALDGDLIARPGPRLIEGLHAICEAMDQVRAVK